MSRPNGYCVRHRPTPVRHPPPPAERCCRDSQTVRVVFPSAGRSFVIHGSLARVLYLGQFPYCRGQARDNPLRTESKGQPSLGLPDSAPPFIAHWRGASRHCTCGQPHSSCLSLAAASITVSREQLRLGMIGSREGGYRRQTGVRHAQGGVFFFFFFVQGTRLPTLSSSSSSSPTACLMTEPGCHICMSRHIYADI